MKTITVRQFAAVKRVAQNVNPLVVKKNKIAAKIDELNAEYNALSAEIEGHEMGIKAITGGLTSESLVVKKVEDTGKVDKDGKPIKKTVYEPNPATLIFNEEKNVYEIHTYEPNICEKVDTSEVDGEAKAPEIEVKAGEEAPIDPITDFTEEDKNNIPFLG